VAEVLKCDWEQCIIERGDSRKNLPWNIGQFGSNTSFTMSRSNYAAAMDLKQKLLSIAALAYGGEIKDYAIDGQRVYKKASQSESMSYAEAAVRAIVIGGKFDGHIIPSDINDMTRNSVDAIKGSGLIGVAKDNYPINGTPPALAAGFMMIELDKETGKFEILEYNGVIDCGTVIHPM
jgi:CO/xanthine dehydrogenase Mo-binding subunit